MKKAAEEAWDIFQAPAVTAPAPTPIPVTVPVIADEPSVAVPAQQKHSLDHLTDEQYYEHMERVGAQPEPKTPSTTVPYPPELASLIANDKVVYDPDYEHWVVKKCKGCGEYFKDVCCGVVEFVSAASHDNKTLHIDGKRALGLIPIKRPEPPKPPQEKWKESGWWNQFRGVEELQGDGTVDWIIQNVVPAGVTVLTGNAKDGKSSSPDHS